LAGCMAEWSMALVSQTSIPKGIAGSNPAASVFLFGRHNFSTRNSACANGAACQSAQARSKTSTNVPFPSFSSSPGKLRDRSRIAGEMEPRALIETPIKELTGALHLCYQSARARVATAECDTPFLPARLKKESVKPKPKDDLIALGQSVEQYYDADVLVYFGP